MTADYTPLWHWVREREAIRLRKESGAASPWTEDDILATYRFCNVRREDDRVTIWIRDNIRKPFALHPHLWLMLCIARIINWPETLRAILDSCSPVGPQPWPCTEIPEGTTRTFDPRALTLLLNRRQETGSKLYTGVYMIPAPAQRGADKQAFIAEQMIGDLWRRREAFVRIFGQARSLQTTHARIMRTDGWGPFLAYQAVVDMRFTAILNEAHDVATWAAAGPGTVRGLNRIHGRPLNYRLDQERALSEMRAIYKIAEAETGVAMDFSDVPNILCETDKHLRVKLGEGKPRALYVPGRGA